MYIYSKWQSTLCESEAQILFAFGHFVELALAITKVQTFLWLRGIRKILSSLSRISSEIASFNEKQRRMRRKTRTNLFPHPSCFLPFRYDRHCRNAFARISIHEPRALYCPRFFTKSANNREEKRVLIRGNKTITSYFPSLFYFPSQFHFHYLCTRPFTFPTLLFRIFLQTPNIFIN